MNEVKIFISGLDISIAQSHEIMAAVKQLVEELQPLPARVEVMQEASLTMRPNKQLIDRIPPDQFKGEIVLFLPAPKRDDFIKAMQAFGMYQTLFTEEMEDMAKKIQEATLPMPDLKELILKACERPYDAYEEEQKELRTTIGYGSVKGRNNKYTTKAIKPTRVRVQQHR